MSTQIRLVGVTFCHADRQMDERTDRETDMKKLMLVFRNFAKAPKNGVVWSWQDKIIRLVTKLSLLPHNGRAYWPSGNLTVPPFLNTAASSLL